MKKKKLYLAIKDNRAVVVKATGTDDAYRVAGKALDIVGTQDDILLDRCEEITPGKPVVIGPA